MMSDYISNVDSLYNITLNQLCLSMNEDILVNVLELLQPTISLQIIWKILRVNDGSKNFTYNHTLPGTDMLSEPYSIKRGRKFFQLKLINHTSGKYYKNNRKSLDINRRFAITQQTKFVDHLNFSDHFDLELLFKFMEVTECRGQLLTIFQICVQIKGLQFPKDLSEEWVNTKILDDNQELIYHHIEEGLKLGIFLGDAGWLNECAQVLSHTYRKITEKWVCLDQNLKQLKIIQCVTKWLLVVSKLHEFNKAKKVLEHMLRTINIIEKMEEIRASLPYAYVAVSQYYYELLEFDHAWLWALKAIQELRDRNGDSLKLLVISHAIKISSVLNKLDTAKKLINQLCTYKKKIDQTIHIEMLLNEAFYSLKAELPEDWIKSYLIALDSIRNLFGYYNLHTAIVLANYAYAHYISYNATTDYYEAIKSLQQSMFIIDQLGFPECSILFQNMKQIKALLIEKALLNGHDNNLLRGTNTHIPDKLRKQLLKRAEVVHSNALTTSINSVGEKSLLTAKSYSHLGKIYESQKKYKKSEKMYLKAIEIKNLILDSDNIETSLSVVHLGLMYIKRPKKLQCAEHLLLLSIRIYLNKIVYGYQFKELQYVLEGLTIIYKKLNRVDDFYEYSKYLSSTIALRELWLIQVNDTVDKNGTEDVLSLRKIKFISNNIDNENHVNL